LNYLGKTVRLSKMRTEKIVGRKRDILLNNVSRRGNPEKNKQEERWDEARSLLVGTERKMFTHRSSIPWERVASEGDPSSN